MLSLKAIILIYIYLIIIILMGIKHCLDPTKRHQRYQILEIIYQSKQTCIYKVCDYQQEKKLKVIKKMIIKPEFFSKVLLQCKYLTQLNHPNIIKPTDCFPQTENRTMYICIIMEFIEGGQLKQQLNKLSQYQIIRIYCQLKSALQYIHSKNIIHRDITLRNILLDDKKNVKLIDFGISTELYEDTKIITIFNEGTKFYLSPQFIKQSIVRKQTDLWQMGIVMIQLATGIKIQELMKSEDDQIVNNPAFNPVFPQKILIKYKINEKMAKLIIPLLKKNYKQRKFCQQVQIMEQEVKQKKIYRIRIKNEIKLDEINVINGKKMSKPEIAFEQIKDQKGIGYPQLQFKQNRYRKLDLSLKKIDNAWLCQNISVCYTLYLVQLNCSNNFLTDHCAKIIRTLTHLQELDISGNNLSDNFCKEMNQMFSQFRKLNLAFTNITSESLFIITKYGRMIESLDISYTRVTNKGITTLCAFTRIQSLFIWSGNCYLRRYFDHINKHNNNKDKYQDKEIDINEQTIKFLQKLRLKQLTANLKYKSANEIISRMKEDARCIEVIGRISKQNIERIKSLNCLQILYLKDANDYEINRFDSRKLVSVGLVNCKIVLEILTRSLSKCEQLRILDLSDNNIDDGGAKVIVNNVNKLTSLNLCNNNISDQGAIYILKNIGNLLNLNLSQNKISQSTNKQIQQRINKNKRNI